MISRGAAKSAMDYAIHAIAWTGLAIAAALNSGSYTFASCWPIPFGLFPPLGIALLAIPVLSLAGLSYSGAANDSPRTKAHVHRASKHGAIFSLGVFGCWMASVLTVGSVSCL